MPKWTAKVSRAEERRLEEFLRALRIPCRVARNESSWFATPAFEEEFRSKLLTHHSFIGSPLFQESFESALVTSCNMSGLEVECATGGQRFWDASINGRHISLKSTKARNLRREVLHISKLTEAAWIQDCRTARRRREETLELFDEYCSQVQAILQLRYFAGGNMYELVEIPVGLFAQVSEVSQHLFAADGPAINIPAGKDPPDFTLRLDRSDAKITIANINKQLCTVHCTWFLEESS